MTTKKRSRKPRLLARVSKQYVLHDSLEMRTMSCNLATNKSTFGKSRAKRTAKRKAVEAAYHEAVTEMNTRIQKAYDQYHSRLCVSFPSSCYVLDPLTLEVQF